MKPVVGCLGAGRMGRGIAVVFAFAGHQVVVVDFKEREASAFEALAAEAKAEIRSTLEILSRIDLLPADLVPTIAARITIWQSEPKAEIRPSPGGSSGSADFKHLGAFETKPKTLTAR